MANAYYYDTSRNEVVKLFSKLLWSEFRKKDALFDPQYGFVGKSEDNLFWYIDDANKSSGDKVTVPYSWQIDSAGVTGNEILEGKETSIDTTDFSLVIDKQRFGVRTGGEMNQQRVHFDTVKEGKNKLADIWKRRQAAVLMNHLCANTPKASNSKYNGFNTISAPDSQHIYRPNSVANDQSLTAGTDDFDLSDVDTMVTMAELLTPPVRPFIFKGNPYYAIFMHPDQVLDLRANNSQWYNTMQNALTGGKVDDNPLFTRALGMWRNCLFFSDPFVRRGINSSTSALVSATRRSVFCGAGAAAIACGRHSGLKENQFRWFSSTWDHGDKYYCSASRIWGVKAVRVNDPDATARDIGKIVYPTSCTDTISGLDNLED